MGAILSKAWRDPGYYYDMVEGFVTRSGGYPAMIYFPKELQSLPDMCTKCHSSTRLQWDKMYQQLQLQRTKYKSHVEEVVAARKARGERHPYPEGKSRGKLRGKSPFGVLRKITSRNEVAPATPSPSQSEGEDAYDFTISKEDLIVCDCMRFHYDELKQTTHDGHSYPPNEGEEVDSDNESSRTFDLGEKKLTEKMDDLYINKNDSRVETI